VAVTGYVSDVRPYLARASVYVVPLHIGGGTRVKALQAMAMQLPIVTTTVGCEGLDLEPGVHALVADDAAAFADAVVQVLQQPALAASLAGHAAQHVRRFAWSRIGDRLEQVFSTAPAAPRRRAAGVLAYEADPH
jgi:glycosyltransferase involved in cell wall biosynthesis